MSFSKTIRLNHYHWHMAHHHFIIAINQCRWIVLYTCAGGFITAGARRHRAFLVRFPQKTLSVPANEKNGSVHFCRCLFLPFSFNRL